MSNRSWRPFDDWEADEMRRILTSDLGLDSDGEIGITDGQPSDETVSPELEMLRFKASELDRDVALFGDLDVVENEEPEPSAVTLDTAVDEAVTRQLDQIEREIQSLMDEMEMDPQRDINQNGPEWQQMRDNLPPDGPSDESNSSSPAFDFDR